MKKLLVFLAILFVSVMSSACINNFAIQELNTKAKEYLDKGDYDEAIKRLESSVDLDGTVFETRYNLAVAYINKGEFLSAINQLNEAVLLDPASPDVYYTLGVALEGEAYKKAEEKKLEEAESPELSEASANDTKKDELQRIFKTKEDAKYAADKLNSAIDAYNKYLTISIDDSDREKVSGHIKDLKGDIDLYMAEYESHNPPQTGGEAGE